MDLTGGGTAMQTECHYVEMIALMTSAAYPNMRTGVGGSQLVAGRLHNQCKTLLTSWIQACLHNCQSMLEKSLHTDIGISHIEPWITLHP